MGGGGSETTSGTQIPQYVQDQHQNNLNLGNTLADRPYQPYTGPRIAGFTPDQQASFQTVRTAASPSNTLGTGWGVANQVQQDLGNWQGMDRGSVRDVHAQTFPGANLDAYLNPYTKTVTDQTLGQLGRQNDILQNQNRARAAAAGAFGGSRGAIIEAEQDRNYLDQAARTARELNLQGFNTAAGLQQADANRSLQADMSNQGMDFQVGSLNQQQALQAMQARLGAAGQMQSSSLADQQRQLGFASALGGVGQQQQGMDQSNYDLAYQDFMRQQGYPAEELQLRQGLLAGPFNQTQTSSTKTDNTGQMVGSGMMAAATMAAAFM